MTFIDQTYLPLKVVKVGGRGKRTFDPDGKRRLIAACRQPGVSISYMALRAGINANQLRKWIGKSPPSRDSAFVPVSSIDNFIDSAGNRLSLSRKGQSITICCKPSIPDGAAPQWGIHPARMRRTRCWPGHGAYPSAWSHLMLRLDEGLKVYLHRDAVDFRKSISGLSALVEQSLGFDPFAQAVYVFRNLLADRIKLLG
ncbi:IS66 family insertion sequence element accessory protein TnpB [Pseudomonas sp. NPDC098747]|uniref:IS66 family insertion sequence element accessory protein TnpB n=1 Tax=Pseudomonas sp. NPDC098747 TaxID=3364487 RepID=UPI00383B00ED